MNKKELGTVILAAANLIFLPLVAQKTLIASDKMRMQLEVPELAESKQK